MHATSPLDWPALCRQVRRPWYADWRGEMPARGDAAPISAPIAIAVCALFGAPRAFAREADAATWRVVGPRALNVVGSWRDVVYAREETRLRVNMLRRCLDGGEAREAAACRAALGRQWTRYRTAMRRLADAVDGVRTALSRRAAPAMAARQDAA
jgi:hypothetical protein